MRDEDSHRLQQPYSVDQNLGDALGVALPAVVTLYRGVNEEHLAGKEIPWWVTTLSAHERFVVSDHLVQCIGSILANVGHFALHRLELLDALERQRSRLRQPVTLSGGVPPAFRSPPIETPMDDLPTQLAALHLPGSFRAWWNALDCLAGGIVGVLGMPTPILSSGIESVRKDLSTLKDPESSAVTALQSAFGARLDARIDRVGPANWWNWTYNMRQQLVHRPRHLQVLSPVPSGTLTGLVDASGQSVIEMTFISRLPRNPGVTNLHHPHELTEVLPESAEETIGGLRDSLIALLNETASDLSDVWAQRKASSELSHQPATQWPHNTKAGSLTDFGGFMSRERLKPSVLVLSEENVQRIRAAIASRSPVDGE